MATNWKQELILAIGMILLEVGGLVLILILPLSKIGKFLLVVYMIAVFAGTLGLMVILKKRG